MATSWLIPPGVIIPWGGPDPNSDSGKGLLASSWLYCDGTLYSQSDYPDLFGAIGHFYGGTDSSSFNVPDLRGYFLRGVDADRHIDPNADDRSAPQPYEYYTGNYGDAVGSLEAFDTKTTVGVPMFFGYGDASADAQFGYNYASLVAGVLKGNQVTTGTVTASSSGLETRPVNSYVYYIICTGISLSSAGSK